MKKMIILSVIIILILSGCIVIRDDTDYLALDLIDEARKLIHEEHPEEEIFFYNFSARVTGPDSESSMDGYQLLDSGAKNLDDLTWWQFIFGCEGNKTAMIKRINGVWQESEIIPYAWGEDIVFSPEYIRIDIGDAIEILKVYIWKDTPYDFFDSVVFRQPLNLETTEPYYIFTVGFAQYIYVGAITGAVHIEIDEI
jgi:hypothetical protein